MFKWLILFLGLTASSAQAIVVEKTTVQASAKIPVVIVLPDRVQGKIPAMILLQGSGGLNLPHKMIYAHAFAEMGVATVIIDSFTHRGIKNTIFDQSTVTTGEMARDAYNVLQHLTNDSRIDTNKVGLLGFSKGAKATLQASLLYMSKGRLAQFSLFIAMYPSCNDYRLHPRTTGKPIKEILGEKDAYNNPQLCLETAEILRKGGADLETITIPKAKHSWDVPGKAHWEIPQGENYSNCKFIENEPKIWIEEKSKIVVSNAQGFTKDRKKAYSQCTTRGVTGGYSSEASAKSMALIKSYITSILE